MNAEAKVGRHENHDDSQFGLYAKDKIEDALSKNAQYSSALNEQLKKSRNKNSNMTPSIEIKIGDAIYQEVRTRRFTKVLGRVVREHEVMILTRTTPDEETKVQFNTAQGEFESIGKVFLFRDGERFVGEEALNLMDSSFPELFPQ